MSKFSVKKPLTVFVAVIAVLVLGVVSYLNMTPDLLPNMDFPYVIIVTTYPGANPEKVEMEITKPLEQSMSTLDHIKEVSSTSSENYSMVMLEFEESADLDTVGVDIQQSISALRGGWDDMVSEPFVLKINPSVLPVAVAAVSMEGMDTVQLTEFLDESLLNKLEGITGVARVSTSGTVVQQLHVVLDQKLLDALNNKLSGQVTEKLDEAQRELSKAKKELEAAQKQLNDGKAQLDAGKQQLTEQTATGVAEVDYQLSQLITARSQMETLMMVLGPVRDGLKALEQQRQQLDTQIETLKQLQQKSVELAAQEAAFEAQIALIQGSGKPQAEIDEEIAALKASAEYVQFAADKAAMEAQLKANNVTAEEIPARIALIEGSLKALDEQTAQLKKILEEQGVEPLELDKKLEELDEGLKQMDAGIAALRDAKVALNKAQMDGLLEMSKATTEMAVGQSTITAALAQLGEGEKTLETTREQTLAQADVNKILTMETVSTILTAQNFAMPAGTLTQEGVNYMVSVGEELTKEEQIRDLVLFDMGIEGVEPVRLTDVAAVMLTDNRDETYARLDGRDSVMLTFEKQSTYATAETTDNILARFEQLEKEYPGLRFVSLMNQGDYIYMIVESIISSLLLGALLAIIILFVFLRDIRPTFITLCSIPISVIFAIVLMYFSGVTINMISLSGLAVAVGMLVDNSVVVIENIYRLRAKGANAVQAAVSGAKQVAGAVAASTLTTVCVFAPIVFVQGITKQLFTDLALTMTYSLMASLIVSLTLVPAMASGMLRKESKHKAAMPKKLMAAYEKAVDWAVRHKAIVLIASALLLVVTTVISLTQGFEFMPAMDMPNVNVTVKMPEEATMEEAVDMADDVLDRIAGLEGIDTVGAMMSSGGLMGGLGGGSGSYDVTIYITLKDENASGAAMGKRIETICAGMDCEVTASSAMMDMSMLTGSGISVQLFSNDMQALQDAAKKTAEMLQGIPGVEEVSDGLEDTAPALHVDVDRNKAMQKGVTVAQIYMELAKALQNETTVTTLNLDGKSTAVIVEKPEESKLDIEKLKEHPFSITTQTGETKEFKLSDVATVEESTSLLSISRVSQRRYLTVTATLNEGENVTLKTAEAERAMKNVDLGDGVTYAFAGENEAIMDAIGQMMLMLLLGVLLVYLVMVAQFQSLKSPFIVMFTIPLAFTGGFAALLICGMKISVISLVGFVMLTGIIVNNGIVLVDYINQLRQEGMERRQAIIEAGSTRLRPILMTTVTTILGLVDMAVRKSAGTALMQPVAVVCIGGLLYATVMTLFVVPCIYDLLNKKELRKVDEKDLEILDM